MIALGIDRYINGVVSHSIYVSSTKSLADNNRLQSLKHCTQRNVKYAKDLPMASFVLRQTR